VAGGPEGHGGAVGSDQASGRHRKRSREKGMSRPFHVKRSLYALPDAVAPHLAARRAGVTDST